MLHQLKLQMTPVRGGATNPNPVPVTSSANLQAFRPFVGMEVTTPFFPQIDPPELAVVSGLFFLSTIQVEGGVAYTNHRTRLSASGLFGMPMIMGVGTIAEGTMFSLVPGVRLSGEMRVSDSMWLGVYGLASGTVLLYAGNPDRNAGFISLGAGLQFTFPSNIRLSAGVHQIVHHEGQLFQNVDGLFGTVSVKVPLLN